MLLPYVLDRIMVGVGANEPNHRKVTERHPRVLCHGNRFEQAVVPDPEVTGLIQRPQPPDIPDDALERSMRWLFDDFFLPDVQVGTVCQGGLHGFSTHVAKFQAW